MSSIARAEMRQVTWPQVGLVLGLTFLLVGGVTVLALNDKSVETILIIGLAVVVPVLSAFGVRIDQKLDHVKEVSNGRLDQVMKMAQDSQDRVTELTREMTIAIQKLQGPGVN